MGQILRNGIRYSIVGNATTSAAGLCPMLEGDSTKYLRSDGQWEVPPNPDIVTTASAGLCPQLTNVTTDYLRADGTWSAVPNPQVVTTSSDGLCPQLAGGTAKYLRADGTWVQPPNDNTTYSAGTNIQISAANVISATDTKYSAGTNVQISAANVISATDTKYNVTSTSAAGLAPKLNGSTANFLRGDGNWATPAYPSVGNGTLTIQKNGSNVATFTANQGGNTTANITVPTNNNQLTNGAGYITSDTRVYQENSSGNADYRVLFSYNVNDNNENSTSRKSNTLTYNPSSGYLHIGNAFGGIHHSGNQAMYFITSGEDEYRMFLGVLNDGGLRWTLCPTSDGKIKLGLPNHKWDTIYAVVGTINTSDRKAKKDINDLDLNTIRKFIMDLNPVSYKMIDGTRTHYGMIAQDIEETMNKLGMTPLDFAGFCKDQKMEQYTEKEINEDGEEVEVEKYKPIEGEYNYGLRYDEFISPMIKVIQDQENRIESLESEVKELKELVNELLKK